MVDDKHDISREAIQNSESSYKEEIICNRIGEFIESILSGKSSKTARPPNESRLTDFIQILKENNADHLIDSKLNQLGSSYNNNKTMDIILSSIIIDVYTT